MGWFACKKDSLRNHPSYISMRNGLEAVSDAVGIGGVSWE